jgi:hypothetical protein
MARHRGVEEGGEVLVTDRLGQAERREGPVVEGDRSLLLDQEVQPTSLALPPALAGVAVPDGATIPLPLRGDGVGAALGVVAA